MSRIPTLTIADAPEGARPLLQKIIQSSPTGRPLNFFAPTADTDYGHAPADTAKTEAMEIANEEGKAFAIRSSIRQAGQRLSKHFAPFSWG